MKREELIKILTNITNILIVAYLPLYHIFSVYHLANYVCLMFMFLICLITFLKKESFFIPKEFLFLIGFCLFAILSLLWSPEPSKGYLLCFKTIPLLSLLAILLYNFVRQNKNPEIFIYSLYATGIVLTVAMVVVYGGIANLLNLMKEGHRLGGIIDNENEVGMALALATIAAFYLLLKKKYWNILAVLVFATMSMATGSRKVLIILVLGGFLSVISLLNFSKGNGRRNVIIISCSLAFLCLCFILLFTIPAFLNIKTRFLTLLNSLLGRSGGDGSTDTRMEMIEVGWNTFKNYPIGGYGVGTTYLLGFNAYLHNNFIEILASLGLIGFFLYYAVYAISFYRIIPLLKERNQHATLACIISICWFVIQVGAVVYETKDTYYYFAWLSILSGLFRAQSKSKPIEQKTHWIIID